MAVAATGATLKSLSGAHLLSDFSNGAVSAAPGAAHMHGYPHNPGVSLANLPPRGTSFPPSAISRVRACERQP